MNEPEPGAGDDLVPLLVAALGTVKSALQGEAQRRDLTMLQMNALFRLAEPLSQRDLAQRLVCDASSVTSIVDRLEERGIVERTIDPDDRRVRTLVLTVKGAALRADALDAVARVPFAHGLDDDERATLRALLRKVVDQDELADTVALLRR